MILEAIYEGSFEYTSHGFRPQRSPQTALSSIQRSFNGTKWFIEGDIKGFFDHINHEILKAILSDGDQKHQSERSPSIDRRPKYECF